MVEQFLSVGDLQKSKYRVGRITNKYLIIDLYAFAYCSRDETVYRMFMVNKSTRNLLIEQYWKSSFQTKLPD